MKFICGLEVHGYLLMEKSKEKLFCTCKTDRDAKPNTTICPRCTAMPGSKAMLPNREAVEKIIACGLMLNCRIQEKLIFQRKHYSWPDLPSGYQRTMSGSYSQPVGIKGNFLGIGITQVHLEEDPAKWDPISGLVDYNRSGYPLIEIVTEPEFTSSDQVVEWLKNLLTTLSYIRAVETKAGIKCDVNVSIPGHPRVEIKNVNSIQAIKLAIEKEVERQVDALKSKENIIQHTRTPPDEYGRTTMMRTKETAEDYKFIPEPDLPVIEINKQFIRVIEQQLPEKPEQKTAKYKKLGLDEENAKIIASDLILAELFEHVQKDIGPKPALRWMRHELLRVVNLQERTLHELNVNFAHISKLLTLAHNNEITDSVAIELLEQVVLKGVDPLKHIDENNLRTVSDEGELKTTVQKILAENQDSVVDYRSGKEKAFNSIVGKIMKETKGKANVEIVMKLIKEMIK